MKPWDRDRIAGMMADKKRTTGSRSDTTVPDIEWWFSGWAESEDFVGIGEERVNTLVAGLRRSGVSEFLINRLLKDNGMPHGPCNAVEAAGEESDAD